MKRVDAAGATIDNLFTTGNPSLGVPATTVDDTIMNAIQEEVAGVVEFAGLTLDQTNADLTQLRTAIQTMIASGGLSQGTFAIDNNISSPTNVTGMVFNKATVKSAKLLINIFRRDDTQSADEVGELFASHNTETDAWAVSFSSKFDDAGVVFTIASSGQVQYTSTNFAGGTESGEMKWSIQQINQ